MFISLFSKLSYWIKRRTRDPLFKKFYYLGLIGTGIFILTVILHTKQTDTLKQETINFILVPTCLFFSIGFLLRIRALTKNTIIKKWFKIPVLVFHALALLLGVIPARSLVSASTGLPPEDFDIAVAIIALGFYPVAWLLLSIVVLLFTYVIGMTIATILTIALSFLNIITINISVFSSCLASPFRWLQIKISSFMDKSWLHFIGATMTLISAVYLFQISINYSHNENKYVVALVYLTDYHENYRYPAVRSGLESKIHANGVVSYAIPEKSGRLRFEVDGIENTPKIFEKTGFVIKIDPFGTMLKYIRAKYQSLVNRLNLHVES